ncbi:hypothetical protein SNE40_001604 [Patella caerulea]|uniref:Uncharacterized protein n=1 Tax=Patella caerulea TaxID=87958 RepID=A0AAN8KE98_PATCE
MNKEELINKVGVLKERSVQLNNENNKLRKALFESIKTKGHKLNQINNQELLDLFANCQSDVEKSFPDINSLQRVF